MENYPIITPVPFFIWSSVPTPFFGTEIHEQGLYFKKNLRRSDNAFDFYFRHLSDGPMSCKLTNVYEKFLARVSI